MSEGIFYCPNDLQPLLDFCEWEPEMLIFCNIQNKSAQLGTLPPQTAINFSEKH